MKLNQSITSILFCLIANVLWAQISNEELDALIQKTGIEMKVPGISVGIIKDGKIVYANAKGVRSISSKLPMTKETLVGIASNSKGFTCFALAMLVDQGKLKWDDPVKKYIPEIEFYDPFISNNITVRDLLTHRAGFTLGMGDLMFFPEGGKETIQSIIHKTKYFPKGSAFRKDFQYNNIMFILAGEVLSRISGKSWAQYIEDNILKPVGMVSSYGSYNRVKNKSNIISAHVEIEGKVTEIPHDWNETANAAGGIMSNIDDMLVWAEFLLNNATTKDGKQLLSPESFHELWTQQIATPAPPKTYYDTDFMGYGLGWFVNNVGEYKQVYHTGGLLGTVTQFTLIPKLKLGIVVLTNQQNGMAFSTITNTVRDRYIHKTEPRDWLDFYKKRQDKNQQSTQKLFLEVEGNLKKAANNPAFALLQSKIIGTYRDAWFGDMVIEKQNNKTRVTCVNSPNLVGELFPYSDNRLVVKWDNKSYDADIFLTVEKDAKGNINQLKAEPISPNTDFSFDFVDLQLKKMK